MATASHVSENPLDYLTMILYVRRGHAVCDQLQLQVAKRMDVLVQDVDQLDGQAPPWLLGVPTAVRCQAARSCTEPRRFTPSKRSARGMYRAWRRTSASPPRGRR